MSDFEMANIEFEAFLDKLKVNKRIIVQAHDFPDHDALSSAYALAYLLKRKAFIHLLPFMATSIECHLGI